MSARTSTEPKGEQQELAPVPGVAARSVGRRLLLIAGVVLVVVAVITLVPGLAGLRTRFQHAKPGWLVLGAGLKVLSGLCYVAVFRSVFCRGMRWRLSAQIGFSELGANAVLPTGGAGGLALGAWALHRAGMDGERIARRSVAFFLLTSLPNLAGVIVIGIGLAAGAMGPHPGLELTLLPAALAVVAIAFTIAVGRRAERSLSSPDSRIVSRRWLARTLKALAGGVSEALGLLRGGDPWLMSGLAGYLAFDVMILWSTFHAFGSAPTLAILWMGYLIGELGGLIPIPGGLGGVDVGLVGTLVLYGVPVGAATAAVLAYRALALVVPAAVGGAAFVALRRTLARETLALANCGPGEEVEVVGRGRMRMSA